MLSLWINITFICTVIGLILMIISVIGISKIRKQLDKMNGDELLPDTIKIKILKYLRLTIIGGTISAISMLIRIFLR